MQGKNSTNKHPLALTIKVKIVAQLIRYNIMRVTKLIIATVVSVIDIVFERVVNSFVDLVALGCGVECRAHPTVRQHRWIETNW